jgi:repressor LexA
MFVTKRQRQLLDYIDKHIRKAGYAPTLAEIGQQFGLTSLATVHKHLSNLETKGLIRRKWNYSRAIEMLPQPGRRQAVDLPLLGRVAAGKPIEAIEHVGDAITVPEEFIRKNHTYALQVSGNSMIADGIWDGDYVIVEERPVPNNGETVVAVIEGEATVKRYFRDRGGKVRLQPANDAMKPIVARAKDVEIRGVVVAVMRKY